MRGIDPGGGSARQEGEHAWQSPFKRFLVARGLSVAGLSATFVAVPILVYDLIGSTFLTSLVAALGGVDLPVARTAGGVVG